MLAEGSLKIHKVSDNCTPHTKSEEIWNHFANPTNTDMSNVTYLKNM